MRPPAAPPPPQQQQKRKKWKEEEERALIDKYAEMQLDGALCRLCTRERRFRPIAAHVNAAHHLRDPTAYPFLWSWKDVSTKAQNMRHQYLLVKQKLISALRSPSDGPDRPSGDPDWSEGLALWPNFLRYRQVFGDAPLKPGLGLGFDGLAAYEGEGDGFDCDEAGRPPLPASAARRRKAQRRGWAVLARQVEKRAELEERREGERRREEEEEDEEAAVRRRREAEEKWEERMERREEWRRRMEEALGRHRAEMEQMHARVLHEQQSIIGQLLGFVAGWVGPVSSFGMSAGEGGGPMSDGTGIGGGAHHDQPYSSQMMQGLHSVDGIVPSENRHVGEGPEEEDQFILDE